jgi:hypothetical protein
MSQQQFPEWLKALGTVRADLPAIDRQVPFSFQITFPGNVTSWGLAGTVKIGPNSTEELAVWAIGTPTYDAGSDRTTWIVSLSASQINALPSLSSGVDYFYYNFLLAGPANVPPPRVIMAGLVTVRGFITETE